MGPTWILAAGSGALLFLLWQGRHLLRRARSLERIVVAERGEEDLVPPTGALAYWLEIAGLRGPRGATLFVLVNAALIGVGALLVLWIERSAVFAQGLTWLDSAPGGIGQVFLPIMHAAPWIVFTVLALAPALHVRALRRRRVREIEQDLPMVLELLATLAQSGLSFDASLARILDSLPPARPLSQELRTFQVEVMAGSGRVACLRRLAARIALGSVSIFVSALVQAEQVGAGFAEVLRRQADDLRDRRREHATVLAQALPVKLVLPLVMCFLPMIFVSTLGPAFHQFFELASNVTRNLR